MTRTISLDGEPVTVTLGSSESTDIPQGEIWEVSITGTLDTFNDFLIDGEPIAEFRDYWDPGRFEYTVVLPENTTISNNEGGVVISGRDVGGVISNDLVTETSVRDDADTFSVSSDEKWLVNISCVGYRENEILSIDGTDVFETDGDTGAFHNRQYMLDAGTDVSFTSDLMGIISGYKI